MQLPPKHSQTELAGQVAVVTGSSSGIGQAIALELAFAGADVVVHARQNRSGAERTAQLVQEQGRQACVCLQDVAEQGQLPGFVEKAWDWQGHVEIWVNNAGADLLTGPPAAWSYEKKLETLLKVDVTATVLLSRLAGLRMKEHGRGVVLTVGWDQAAGFGMAGESGELFATSKGAIMAFTRSLALSLAPEVRVNCLAPGWIKTAWGDQASESWQQRAVRESALARWGQPQDVASVARFLASPAAGFITGQIIPINGGFRPTF